MNNHASSRIFLTPKDIVVLTGYHYKAAWKVYDCIRSSLGKPTRKKITIQEYCRIEMVSEAEVKKALNLQ